MASCVHSYHKTQLFLRSIQYSASQAVLRSWTAHVSLSPKIVGMSLIVSVSPAIAGLASAFRSSVLRAPIMLQLQLVGDEISGGVLTAGLSMTFASKTAVQMVKMSYRQTNATMVGSIVDAESNQSS